jgi:tRNA (mo5U34)-methyltransferase
VGAGARSADPELTENLRAAVRDAAPTSADDPDLTVAWYHTVELGNGLRSDGRYDLRPTVDMYGLPESLEGMTALDVGTCDGFWAFEMERRGADRVVAIDVERLRDFDLLPWVREGLGPMVDTPMDHRFWLAHAMRGSRVERKLCSVYDLSPETVGTFDVVFCGSLLMHLQNPLKALVNICSVTKEMAIIASLHSAEIEQAAPDKPWLAFGHRHPDLETEYYPGLGAQAVYWHVNTRGLRELMEYAGFARTEPLEPVPLSPTATMCAVAVGYPKSSG